MTMTLYDLVGVLRSTARAMGKNLVYLGHNLLPMAVMLVPMTAIMVLWSARPWPVPG